MPQERRPARIHPGTPSLQHLHLCLANHRLQSVCIHQPPSNHACWWRLTITVEGVLSKDMATVGQYLQILNVKLSTTKAVLAVFHLNNKEVQHMLKVNYNNEIPLFCSEPTYLGLMLDSTFMYHWHLESLRKKMTSRIALLKRLAGYSLGAGETTLRRATLVLLHATAKHCTRVWFRSAHTYLIYSVINDLRTVTECLHPTPANNFPYLTSIQTAKLRREGATLSVACRPMEPGHLLHSALTYPSSGNARHRKSRHPFVTTARQLISSSDDNNGSATLWAD